MFKISKVISHLLSILLIQFSIISFVSAQNIDAVLGSKDSSSAFQVMNSEGDTVFTIGSDGSGVFSKFDNVHNTRQVQINTPNNILAIDGRDMFRRYSGRHISLMSGGNIILNTPVSATGSNAGGRIEILAGPAQGGIKILGGSNEDGGAGVITLRPGDGAALNLFGGNLGSWNWNKGGDVNIKSGGWTSSVNISSGDGAGGDAGDINLTGGAGEESRGGDIILTPGIGGFEGEDGTVIINGSGTYSGTWTQASDKRFKKNINKINDPTEKLIQLEPVTYDLRKEEFPDKHFEDGEQIGLIAQDVEKLFPQLVKDDEDGYKTIDYTKLSVLLLAEIKNQRNEIEELKQLMNKILTESYQLSLRENNE